MTDTKPIKLSDATEEQCLENLKIINDQLVQNRQTFDRLKSRVDNGNTTLLRLTNEKSNAESIMQNMTKKFKELQEKKSDDDIKQMETIKNEHKKVVDAYDQVLTQLDGSRRQQIDIQNETMNVAQHENGFLRRCIAVLQRITEIRAQKTASLESITEEESTEESTEESAKESTTEESTTKEPVTEIIV